MWEGLGRLELVLGGLKPCVLGTSNSVSFFSGWQIPQGRAYVSTPHPCPRSLFSGQHTGLCFPLCREAFRLVQGWEKGSHRECGVRKKSNYSFTALHPPSFLFEPLPHPLFWRRPRWPISEPFKGSVEESGWTLRFSADSWMLSLMGSVNSAPARPLLSSITAWVALVSSILPVIVSLCFVLFWSVFTGEKC